MRVVAEAFLVEDVVAGLHEAGVVGVDVADVDPGAHAVGLEIQPERADDVQVFVEQQARLGVGVPAGGLFFAEPQAVEKEVGLLVGGLHQRRDVAAVQRRLLHEGDGRDGPAALLQGGLQGGGLVLRVAQEEAEEDRPAAFGGFRPEMGLYFV